MNELTYTRNGDYLIPDLRIAEPERSLTKYGMMRKSYLQKHRRILFVNLALSEKLYPHCLEIEDAANERLELMMSQLTQQSQPPDKRTDPMGWTAHMNSLKAQAEEVILTELIYN